MARGMAVEHVGANLHRQFGTPWADLGDAHAHCLRRGIASEHFGGDAFGERLRFGRSEVRSSQYGRVRLGHRYRALRKYVTTDDSNSSFPLILVTAQEPSGLLRTPPSPSLAVP